MPNASQVNLACVLAYIVEGRYSPLFYYLILVFPPSQNIQPESGLKADRILELNVEHPAFQALEAAVEAEPEKARTYASLLYHQALLIAGLPLEDPSGYTDLVCGLMK